jgi:sortase A
VVIPRPSTGDDLDVDVEITEATPEVDLDASAGSRARPVRRTGPPVPGLVVTTLALVMVVCVLAAFFGVFAFGLSGLQEKRSQHLLYDAFRGALDPSSPSGPSIGGPIKPGSPVALITAPAAGIHNVVVVEGTSSGELLAGPGHRRDTPLPGQAGESVLVGKSATAGAPFGRLTRLAPGDAITVRTGQGLFRFTVQGRPASTLARQRITADTSLLVLATAAGSQSHGLARLSPGHLIYVEARLQGNAVTAPPHQPRTLPSTELQGHSDAGAWPYVAGWLAGLVVASGLCWWLWARWGLLRTWIIGAPLLLGLLWGASSEAMRLLPNVY